MTSIRGCRSRAHDQHEHHELMRDSCDFSPTVFRRVRVDRPRGRDFCSLLALECHHGLHLIVVVFHIELFGQETVSRRALSHFWWILPLLLTSLALKVARCARCVCGVRGSVCGGVCVVQMIQETTSLARRVPTCN